jgi:hypothetical protein
MKLDKYADEEAEPLKKTGLSKKQSKQKEKRVNVPLKEHELNGLEELRSKIETDETGEVTLSNLVRIACRIAGKSTSYKADAKDVLESIRRGRQAGK